MIYETMNTPTLKANTDNVIASQHISYKLNEQRFKQKIHAIV